MKIREVTAPLPVAEIKEFFQDKELFFHVDYAGSKLKGKVLLTYLANLDLPADIKLSEDIEEEALFELIDAYTQIKTITAIDVLKAMMAHILLKYVGADTQSIFSDAILTEDQVDRYIKTRPEIVARWKFFLDSTMVYLLYIHQELNKGLQLDKSAPQIDDAMYIGHNVVNLFSVTSFMELFQGHSKDVEIAFFVPQFTQHMFKGDSLFPYFTHENNLMVPMMTAMVEGMIPIDPAEIFDEHPEENHG